MTSCSSSIASNSCWTIGLPVPLELLWHQRWVSDPCAIGSLSASTIDCKDKTNCNEHCAVKVHGDTRSSERLTCRVTPGTVRPLDGSLGRRRLSLPEQLEDLHSAGNKRNSNDLVELELITNADKNVTYVEVWNEAIRWLLIIFQKIKCLLARHRRFILQMLINYAWNITKKNISSSWLTADAIWIIDDNKDLFLSLRTSDWRS